MILKVSAQKLHSEQVSRLYHKGLTVGKKSIFTISASLQKAQTQLSVRASRTNEVSCREWKARRRRPGEWECRQPEFRKPRLCSLSAAFAPANWHRNLHAFFMTRVGWQALPLSLSLLVASHLCSNTHTHTQTESNTHHHTFFQPQLSYLPKLSKTISLTNSLPNSEWHFILRRRRGQKDTELDKRR